MKKIKILLIGLVLLMVTGCTEKTKEVKSLNDFYNIATEKDFIVSDNMANYAANYIKEAMVANFDDISLEMVIYDNSDNASNVQEEQINAFMTRKSTNMVTKKYSGENYYKYTMITNGYYLVSSRIENTLIFTNTTVTNKDKVDSVLDALGY